MSRPSTPRPSAADARAEAQARARARRADVDARIEAHFGEDVPGSFILRVNLIGTAAFVVATLLAVVVGPGPIRLGTLVLDLALFAVGCVVFVVALVAGGKRTRDAEMTMSGWWFLDGSAPSGVRRRFLGAIAVQTAVSIAGAAARPFTSLAFGILVPTFGLAMCGLWGALHGWFPPRISGGGVRR